VGVIASVLLAGALWEEGFGYGPSLTAALALLAAAWPGPVLVAGNAAAQSGIGWLAGRGVVLRSLAVVSCIARARTAFFAKTGTLTYGHPQVAEVVPLKEGKEPEDILFLATVLEVRSEHPIAEGILGAGGGQRRTIPALRGFRAIPGKGLRAQYKGKETLFGNLPLLADAGIDVEPAQKQHDAMAVRGLTPLTLSWGGELMGLVGMVDEERHGARQSIAELREMGLRCVVLTGDCSPTAETLVQNLQMDGAIAGLSLLGKAEVVRAEKARGRVPLAIGHGLADASALGAAEVGVALGAADDLVLDAAQGLVLGSDPRAVSWLVHCARRARSASRRALVLALSLCSTVLGIFAFQAAASRPLPAFAAALSTLTATFAASYLAGSWVRGGPEPGGEANGKSTPKL
jgi:cation transport ATPase